MDANHIPSDQGVVDGFGHVSLRHPDRPDLFLPSRSMAPVLVEAGGYGKLYVGERRPSP